MEQKDEKKIIVCAKASEKKNRKHGYESDDSADDAFSSKGKNVKSIKSEKKSTPCSRKRKH